MHYSQELLPLKEARTEIMCKKLGTDKATLKFRFLST